MSIEDHIKDVDWNRVHKKQKEMDQAKRQLQGLFVSIIPLYLFGNTDILNVLEQLGPHVQISSLKILLRFIMVVYCFFAVYSGYNYFKWSRYDVMCSSTPSRI